MDVREKLAELLKSVLPNFRNNMAYWGEKPIYEFADCLLANGVTVQECKLGAKKTNADRIRNMTDEELAEFLTDINPTSCQDCGFSHGWRCQPDRDDYSDFEKCKEGRKRWLQMPAGEADNETIGERKDGND